MKPQIELLPELFNDINMKKNKNTVGRPTIQKDPKRKQMNVMISGELQDNETFKERVKYMSFSNYVNSLIDADLTNSKNK